MSKYFTRKRNDTRPVTIKVQADLIKFHKLYFENHTLFEFRLKILKKYANKKYIHVNKDVLARRRKRFNNRKVKSYISITDTDGSFETCRLCEIDYAQCRHHVVQLQHGGFKGGRNVIFLCNNCHALIHPWLSFKTESV
jgi:hypothetical protein